MSKLFFLLKVWITLSFIKRVLFSQKVLGDTDMKNYAETLLATKPDRVAMKEEKLSISATWKNISCESVRKEK